MNNYFKLESHKLLVLFLGLTIFFSCNSNNKKIEIYEGPVASQPNMIFHIENGKVFEGFSGSQVIRNVEVNKVYKENGSQEEDLLFTIIENKIYKKNSDTVSFIYSNNKIYQGENEDPEKLLLSIDKNGIVYSGSEESKVKYVIKGDYSLEDIAASILADVEDLNYKR